MRPAAVSIHRCGSRPPRSNRSSSETFRRLPEGSIDLATLCSAIGRRSSSYVSSSDPGAQPLSTQLSFQPRLNPSAIAVFIPVPPREVTVGGIADQERVARSETVGDGCGKGESVLIDNAYGHVGNAGTGPDPRDELTLTEIGHAFHSRIPAKAVKPAVTLTRGEESAGSRRVSHIHPVTVAPDDFPQRRADNDR